MIFKWQELTYKFNKGFREDFWIIGKNLVKLGPSKESLGQERSTAHRKGVQMGRYFVEQGKREKAGHRASLKYDF